MKDNEQTRTLLLLVQIKEKERERGAIIFIPTYIRDTLESLYIYMNITSII
jgi:hypothetical protein